MPSLTPGYLFVLGRSAALKIIHVRPGGGPEKTSDIGEISNILTLTTPMGFLSSNSHIYGAFLALNFA